MSPESSKVTRAPKISLPSADKTLSETVALAAVGASGGAKFHKPLVANGEPITFGYDALSRYASEQCVEIAYGNAYSGKVSDERIAITAGYERAADFYKQALEINREIVDIVRQATNLIDPGATALPQKDSEAAGLFYRDGLKISSEMAGMNGTLYCLEGVAGE